MAERASPRSLRIVDARFALPSLPRTCAVLDGLEDWRAGFEAAGVQQVAPGTADVVVARASSAAAALAHARPATIVVGGGSRASARPARRLKSLPASSPRVLVDLAHPVAAAHAVQRLLPATGRRGAARNRVVATLLRRAPSLVRIQPDVSVHLAHPGGPAMITAIGAASTTPWCLGLSSGRTERKCAFFLFADGNAPDRVLKFKRLPGGGAHFDAVAVGLERARAAGGVIAESAPRLLGRAELHGHPLLLESAVRGIPLQRLLVAPGAEAGKLDHASRVATWAITAGAQTARRGGSGTSVFEHGDLWEENVIVDGDAFALVDWEESTEDGVPLWDLVYFALHALPLLAGARADDERLEVALAIARGQHRLSGVLRGWVRRYVAAIGLADEEVGPVLAGRWRRWLDGYHSAPPEAAGWFVPLLGRTWLEADDLGAAWRSWR